ncbi:hypothetical protein P7K49_010798 [Saguinus oedipus]|uniref:Uncharacterized protein n=1 Tax=Saguinus oedipus TaxID=9490 RepID=A0ABQ9VS65_SAGOE|nr:hypothetical protein P7K49_010798 [Saguinus oedipus]
MHQETSIRRAVTQANTWGLLVLGELRSGGNWQRAPGVTEPGANWGGGCPATYRGSLSLTQMHSIRNLPSMRFREQHREDGVEDMTQLE